MFEAIKVMDNQGDEPDFEELENQKERTIKAINRLFKTIFRSKKGGNHQRDKSKDMILADLSPEDLKSLTAKVHRTFLGRYIHDLTGGNLKKIVSPKCPF